MREDKERVLDHWEEKTNLYNFVLREMKSIAELTSQINMSNMQNIVLQHLKLECGTNNHTNRSFYHNT